MALVAVVSSAGAHAKSALTSTSPAPTSTSPAPTSSAAVNTAIQLAASQAPSTSVAKFQQNVAQLQPSVNAALAAAILNEATQTVVGGSTTPLAPTTTGLPSPDGCNEHADGDDMRLLPELLQPPMRVGRP